MKPLVISIVSIFLIAFSSPNLMGQSKIDPSGDSCERSKPLPRQGCQTLCVDGRWESRCAGRECDAAKPVPEAIGCTYKCVDGRWRRECSSEACGKKPLPNANCEVLGCENGRWQIKCGDPERCPKTKPTARSGCDIKCVAGRWIENCEE